MAEAARWRDLFFLRFEPGIIGVTADHVVSAYESAVAANPNIVFQLGTSPVFDLSGAIIARDAVRDIATFAVSDALVTQIEAVPFDCRGGWPPPEPQYLWKLSLCGLPESLRTPGDDRDADFQAWGGSLAVEHVTPDEIVTINDSAWAEPVTWAPNLSPPGFDMSGCSGGPVLMHVIWNGLYRWFPVALIAEGPRGAKKQGAATEFDTIRLRRIHIIQPDGTVMQRAEDSGGWLPG